MGNNVCKKGMSEDELKINYNGGKNKMFKPKKEKLEETEEVPKEDVAVDEIIEEETDTGEEEEEAKDESAEEETKDNKLEEQKVNLTSGEVISIVEFNLQRAIQSLQLLK